MIFERQFPVLVFVLNLSLESKFLHYFCLLLSGLDGIMTPLRSAGVGSVLYSLPVEELRKGEESPWSLDLGLKFAPSLFGYRVLGQE